MNEDFLTLYLDPGEDFGWALGCGTKLLARGTEKMWFVADAIYDALINDDTAFFSDPSNARDGVDLSLLALPIRRVVCEDWRLYPNKLRSMKWDKCRTARVIGDVTGSCRRAGIELVFQPASIKEAAQAAGAEEFYDRPLRPNRHQNDAMQHFVFYTNTVLMQGMGVEERYKILGIPNNASEGGDED